MTPEEQEAWAVVADMEHDISLVVEEADELRAEVERLRAEIITWGQIWNDEPLLTARAEALRDGTADLGRPRDG